MVRAHWNPDYGAIAETFATALDLKVVDVPDKLGVSKQTWEKFAQGDDSLRRSTRNRILDNMLGLCRSREHAGATSYALRRLSQVLRYAIDQSLAGRATEWATDYSQFDRSPEYQMLLVESQGNFLAGGSRELLNCMTWLDANLHFPARHVYDLEGDFARQCERHFDTIISAEVVDIARGLDCRSRSGFFCTDTSLSSQSPASWGSRPALATLIENSELLARQFALPRKRDYTRFYILQSEDSLFSCQDALFSFVELVQRQVDCGIAVGVIRSDALASEHTSHLHNCYMVPDKVALFGSQPIPVTARFDASDAMGKAMVGLAESFRQHILGVARERCLGFLVDDPMEVKEVPQLLQLAGLLSDE
jgi:hypothetical protein